MLLVFESKIVKMTKNPQICLLSIIYDDNDEQFEMNIELKH